MINFSIKATDIYRVLLVIYPRTLSLRKLSQESHVSLTRVFNITNELINERILIHGSDYKLKLIAPHELLRKWAIVNNFVANTEFIEYYTDEVDIKKFFGRFKDINVEYAFTGLAGALLVAPFVRPTNVHIYVKTKEDSKKIAEHLNLIPIEANGNVKFAIPKSEGVFYGSREIEGTKVVSDIQLYVDLLNFPARGEEASTEIYKLIENNWSPKSQLENK
jgi:hypothetical protein